MLFFLAASVVALFGAQVSAQVVDDGELMVPAWSPGPADRNDKAPPFRGTSKNEAMPYSVSVPASFASSLTLLLPDGFEFAGGAGNSCSEGDTMCAVGGADGVFQWRGIRRAGEGTEQSGMAWVCAVNELGEMCSSGVLQRVALVAP